MFNPLTVPAPDLIWFDLISNSQSSSWSIAWNRGSGMWTTCLRLLRSSVTAGARTHNPWIASPTRYRLATAPPHLLSHFIAHRPTHWKSQTAHSDTHHPISGMNSLIHSVSLASQSLPHSLVSSSLSSSPLSSSSLLHSSLQAQNLPFNKSCTINTSSTLDCLHDHGTGPD